jgi:hypothetical protein
MAASGGSRYNPTMSRTLSMNSGSVDSFQLVDLVRFESERRQIRETAVWFRPTALAIDRVTSDCPDWTVAPQAFGDDCLDLGIADLPRCAGTRLVEQSVDPVGDEPLAPLADRWQRHTEPA